jgi:PAS domain S-box-containing protein
MMRVWSHRPQSLHLALFFAGYVLGCGFAKVLGIAPGTNISIWPPGGLFMATLIVASPPSWPWWMLVGCPAELLSQLLWWHSPLPAGFLMYVGNALEAAAGAWLVNRTCKRPVRMETLQEVLALVVLGAGLAPVISATVGSATLAWFGIKSQSFATAWPLWWIGDATGVLLVAPPVLVVLHNWRRKAQLSAVQWIEAGVLGLIFLGAAALSLSGYYLPFAYIIMPPLLWAAVRFEFKGVAVALTLLALMTVIFTLSGASEFAGDPESQKQKQIMLQLFLAISAFSALIVAAISRQHQVALLTLRQSVEALRERERELSRLVDIVPAYIRRLTPEGEPVFFNKRLIDFLGLDVADLEKLGMSRLAAALQTLVHPDDVTSVRETVSHSLANGAPYAMKYRIRRADGAYRWVDGRAEPVRDESGATVQWYSVSFDIDDQVRAQEALRERERALSQLVETLPAMIDCAAPDGEPIYRSHQLREFLGYNLEELDGSGKSRLDGTLDAGVHPDDLAGLKEKYAHSLATGEPYARRHRLRRFDGEYRWVETRAAPMRDAVGAIVQWNVICLDIDGEVRAQEELRLAQEKMARAGQATSLAELSASIAHEVNQPLAAIVANSHACHRWLSTEPPNIERAKITAERITRDANSAAEVVSRVRALFSHMAKARSPADMTQVIAEVCRLMADELAVKKVRVETEFDRSLPPALIDRVQLQQVLVNLIRNAIDALDAIADGTRLIRLRAVLDGDSAIRVEVRDLGAGLKEPERVFEPFFTTKENGMGMGLAICRSIIEAHDGRLWAADNQPRGTTLAFTLPVQARDAA